MFKDVSKDKFFKYENAYFYIKKSKKKNKFDVFMVSFINKDDKMTLNPENAKKIWYTYKTTF